MSARGDNPMSDEQKMPRVATADGFRVVPLDELAEDCDYDPEGLANWVLDELASMPPTRLRDRVRDDRHRAKIEELERSNALLRTSYLDFTSKWEAALEERDAERLRAEQAEELVSAARSFVIGECRVVAFRELLERGTMLDPDTPLAKQLVWAIQTPRGNMLPHPPRRFALRFFLRDEAIAVARRLTAEAPPPRANEKAEDDPWLIRWERIAREERQAKFHEMAKAMGEPPSSVLAAAEDPRQARRDEVVAFMDAAGDLETGQLAKGAGR